MTSALPPPTTTESINPRLQYCQIHLCKAAVLQVRALREGAAFSWLCERGLGFHSSGARATGPITAVLRRFWALPTPFLSYAGRELRPRWSLIQLLSSPCWQLLWVYPQKKSCLKSRASRNQDPLWASGPGHGRSQRHLWKDGPDDNPSNSDSSLPVFNLISTPENNFFILANS